MTREAAAALLGTTPAVLSLWEERFGYPVPERSEDGQPLYPAAAMIALRDALNRECSVAAAISEARRARLARRRRQARPPRPADGFVLFLERRQTAR